MVKAILTPDQDAVISEIEIAAPPERVFKALITREQALQWGANQAFQMTRWEMDARPGLHLAGEFSQAPGSTLRWCGGNLRRLPLAPASK
jgi:uncharacterized protein YndB with AHSA1/START domain